VTADCHTVRHKLRGHSGGSSISSNDVRYILGLARNAVLQRESAEWLAWVAEAHRLDGQSHRVFGTLSYAAQTWDRPRRVIVKAEPLRGGDAGKSNPRYVATNLADDARALYENAYCRRGDSENRIKEQQLGLFADRTSCHAFLANNSLLAPCEPMRIMALSRRILASVWTSGSLASPNSRIALMLRIALALALGFAAVTLAGTSNTKAEDKKAEAKKLEGTLTCAKCALGETSKCTNALIVKQGDKKFTYYFVDKGQKETYHACAKDVEGVTVTWSGKIVDINGRKMIEPTKVEIKK